jgi:hypothetical protein
MTTIRQIKEISLAADDTESAWIALNSKYGDNNARSFSGSLVAGDTITIQLTNDIDPNTSNTTRVSSDAYSSTTFGGVYDGGFRWTRIVKTGTNGAASVKIEL